MKPLRPVHTGKVVNGKLELDNREYFLWDIEGFEGMTVEIEIIPRKENRSLLMNRYYWGIVVAAIRRELTRQKTFGYNPTADFVHDILKAKFLGFQKYLLPDNTIIEMTNTSKDLSNGEFIAFFESIRAWAKEFLNIEIPLPPKKE